MALEIKIILNQPMLTLELIPFFAANIIIITKLSHIPRMTASIDAKIWLNWELIVVCQFPHKKWGNSHIPG